jgi:HEAT repeat protein
MVKIRDLLKKMGDSDPAVAFEAYKLNEKSVMNVTAPGEEAQCDEFAMTLAEELNAKEGDEGKERLVHTAEVRNKICRLLGFILDGSVVPPLIKAIEDFSVREMARFALDRNTSDEATKALVDALGGVGPDFRTGVVNALGRRSGPVALAALRQAAKDQDPEVSMAAVEALANFPDPTNDDLIVEAAKNADPAMRNRAHRARVRLAETLREAGKQPAAENLYKAISSSDAGNAQRRAADIGLKAMP